MLKDGQAAVFRCPLFQEMTKGLHCITLILLIILSIKCKI